jgi:hypothetical protein
VCVIDPLPKLFLGDVECALLLSTLAVPGKLNPKPQLNPNPYPAAPGVSFEAAGGGSVSTAEIRRHALALGLDLPSEDGLLWIAEAALKAPLPDNWQQLSDALGRIFYYHATSGRKIIERPHDAYYRRLLAEIRRKLKCEAALGITLPEQVCSRAAPAKL